MSNNHPPPDPRPLEGLHWVLVQVRGQGVGES